ncbi:MAG TPA: hypothetical protein VOB72_24575 [Candidatus Dormibacteraeota bacterium]|nr:hypothetical protein [Candidatus Dormibacteraeota bacterium]
MTRSVEYSVEHGDVLETAVDVLVLKHAQRFYGVDLLVASRLGERGRPIDDLRLRPGTQRLVDGAGVVAARTVLFVGTPPLAEFGYAEIRQFSRDVLVRLASDPSVRSVGMTLHGAGYGLDEVESALAQIGGCMDAVRGDRIPPSLERIRVIEKDDDRCRRVYRALQHVLPPHWSPAGRLDDRRGWILHAPSPTWRGELGSHGVTAPSDPPAGLVDKPRAFVAMPFAKDMEDVYHFGISGPVRDQGFVCERIDQETFTGDIVSQLKRRIETSAIVIADLTGANPNVYLEIGYAWALGRPCILLIRGDERPRFDVQGERHIRYETIKELEIKLGREIAGLRAGGRIG